MAGDRLFEVTSPDNVLVSGWLTHGAVASSHVGTIPFAGSNYRTEIHRHDGTLVAVGEGFPQLGTVELLGAQRGNTLAPLPVPSRFNIAPPATPAGEAGNIGQVVCRVV